MAESGKSILIDTTKCFACRSCQVACKQWNENPAEDPVPTNRGSYENPPDLSYSNWVLIHFKESERPDGTLAWNFVRQSCRHCIDAPCKQAAENADSITIDEETGAVLFQDGTRDENFEKILKACPFNTPRQGPDGCLPVPRLARATPSCSVTARTSSRWPTRGSKWFGRSSRMQPSLTVTTFGC